VKEIAAQDGVANVVLSRPGRPYTHFHVFFYMLPIGERTVVAGPGRRTRPAHPREHPGANPDGRRTQSLSAAAAAAARFSINASLLGPTSTSCTTTRSRSSRRASTRQPGRRRTDYSNASPEVQVAVDRARAADLGVRMATVGSTLRLMVAGDDEISSYREGGEQYPVKIRVLETSARHRRRSAS
jgi:multidrug efflux pump subunit AcrB